MTSLALQERIDHLEHCLREITTPDNSGVPESITRPACRRLLGALLNANGRAVPYEGLLAAMFWDRQDCDWPEGNVLQAQICYLRRDLKAAGSPIEIENVSGWGYRVDPKCREVVA